ncbi:hypothetical protein C8R46DRAFT_951099 [Mycena filopes]|nr:hypothetical protein C8R46DRAFT_951099 [Mycena filopes]
MSSKHSAQPLLVSVPANAGLPQYYQQPPTYHTITVPIRLEVQQIRPRRSPLRRFLVALFLAVGIWATLRTLVIHHKHRGHQNWAPYGWNTPSDLALDQCVTGSAWGSSATALTSDLSPAASFEIPLKADTVLLLSSYSQSSFFSKSSLSGNLDVKTSPDLNDTAKVVVHSFAGMRTDGNIRACLMTGENGRIGVGIFRKGVWWDSGSTFMKISLILPATGTPPQVEGLEIHLPNFTINVADLNDAVAFKSVSVQTSNSTVQVKALSSEHIRLRTSNAAIKADSLVSTDLTLKTSNAGISGNFNTSSSLHLTTSNAPIDVVVGLESLNKTGRPTVLVMRTSNNRLNAKVTLTTNASKDKGGAFNVLARTSNGPLNLSVPGSPVQSKLTLNAITSNARAEVRLHRAYQGAFAVSTSSHFPVEVRRLDGSEEDSRRIEYRDHDGGHGHGHRKGEDVRGVIYEKEAHKGLGKVRVRTSNAGATLLV